MRRQVSHFPKIKYTYFVILLTLVIINKCQKGGLNFPEFFQKMFAFRMNFLSRLLNESYVAFWKSTCLYFFSKVKEMKLGIEILFCKMNLTCLPEFYSCKVYILKAVNKCSANYIMSCRNPYFKRTKMLW
jgi:hypothetical protein